MENVNTSHGHGHHDDTAAAHAGASHGSVKSYLIGFVLAVVLTVVPFVMVMNGSAAAPTLLATMLGCAVVQIVVHLVYFLHLDGSSAQRWNLMAFLFTLVILFIVVGGSLWIMYYLNHNMMVM
ncbi:cytochrome O ubiquinol oxidase [Pandoraea thiooxydans]|uniref:Cytochrome bo(3) ubiquinol oxidase subunit 4 n=1 Tax=Pandoraea thiooxydans TaxID=445709 RepID=A0A0G3EQN8_9BURK|nr:cytochrome o ubiquinol oxidase subunit IV [Pandoraea thiooxydans]AKJ66991.1 cytochrome o ubiquinol oxidase subunit IV [Pandoraea thiooxydans]APR93900.1 cytochrome O ubiquinol oxidase [Pandoraea thiooxydans]